jgi:hypothetical protein
VIRGRQLTIVSALGALLSRSALGADPAPDADAKLIRDRCVDAHAQAQEARQNGDLQGARELLRVCTQSACPQVVRADCAPWYDEVDRSVPSLVFAVSSAHGDETAVSVTMDGVPLLTSVSSAATDVNPGQHTFHFELPGYAPVDQSVLVREGEKSRVVYVRFAPSEPAASPPSAAPTPVPAGPPTPAMTSRPSAEHVRRPIPLTSYVLAGTAVVGLAWGSYFGGKALSARARDAKDCQPICDEDTVHSVREKALLADAGFALAALSASAAVYFYLTRPTVSDTRSLAIGVSSSAHGPRLNFSGAF